MTTDSRPPSLTICVEYEDRPDLIQVRAAVIASGWSAVTFAYASPDGLEDAAKLLARWAENPVEECVVNAGADTGIGWLKLSFYPVDMARHVACSVQMATSAPTRGRPQEVWRAALEVRTEPGLIIRFAKELESLARTGQGEAVLEGVNG